MIESLSIWQCLACGVDQASGKMPTVRVCLACRRQASRPSRMQVLRGAGCPARIFAIAYDPAWPRQRIVKGDVDLATWSGDPEPILLISGDVGLGKSMLAAELLWLAASRCGKSVLWTTAGEYVRRRFTHNASDEYDTIGTLVVDDLGRDHPGTSAWDAVGSLIIRRSDRRRQTIVTGNLSFRFLYKVDAALADRLRAGPSVRMLGSSGR